jgi:hypothetical protein
VEKDALLQPQTRECLERLVAQRITGSAFIDHADETIDYIVIPGLAARDSSDTNGEPQDAVVVVR